MYKCILLLAALLCGCSSATEDLRPFVAVAGRYALMSQVKPTPAPSGVCSNCRGLGYLTDGTVRTVCPVCKGNKVTSSSAPCKDGTCPPNTTR